MKPYVFRSQVPVSADYKPPEGNYNQLSGGLPHSEIQGSKPITGSPWLIAGYHVLHRLLLPRHPPNALLALDLIQKKTSFFRSKATLSRSGAGSHRNMLVSVLDLDNIVLPVEPADDPPLGTINDIVITLFTMSKPRPIGRSNASSMRLMVKSAFGGAYRDRTGDPLLAKQVLSQLS